MSVFRSFPLAAALIFMLGCPAPPSPAECEIITSLSDSDLQLRLQERGGIVEVGAEHQLIAGFQGGFMVVPVLLLPAGYEDQCLRVSITNSVTGDRSVESQEFSAFLYLGNDGNTRATLNNFLANSPVGLYGETLTMRISFPNGEFSSQEVSFVLTREM